MAKKKTKRRKNNLAVCIPDVHCPDTDSKALEWALDQVRELNPYRVILLGDLMDFHSISRFGKSPAAAMTFPYEKRAGRALIKKLDQEFRRKEVIYILGNHEYRLAKYLWKHAPELSELGDLAITELLKVPDRWEVVPFGGAHMEQGVICMHGKKFSKNVLNSNLSEYACSSIQGHSHRLGVIHRRLPDGRVISAAECGTLQNLDVDYCVFTNWCQGIGIIENGNVRIVRRE